ncbi:MAG: DUF4340 domain-containing protein [Clostridiales bacterium]|nr:DUF4340 domain-containing protein [Clostridiales bacterium]
MSRSKKLIILAAVLVVCLAGYLIIAQFLSDDEDSSSIEISSLESSSIESIKWVYSGNEIEILRDDDDAWYYADDAEFPLDQDIAEDMESAVSSITAVKMVAEDPEDLSLYGIDDPTVSIYVTVDGETIEYDIGSYNESSGYYYMMYTGDSALYYVDSTLYSTFCAELLDLVEYEYLPEIDSEDAESAVLTYNGSAYNLEVVVDEDDNTDIEYYITDEDGNEYLCDSTAASNMFNGFINVSWASCADYNVSEDSLSEYGLDDPYIQFALTYTYTVTVESETATGDDDDETEEQTLTGYDTLLIGNTANDDGDRYAMISGGNNVYVISADYVEYYEISSYEDLLSKTLLSYSEDEIVSLTVTYKDTDYEITVEEGEDEDGYTVYTYSCNGTEIDMDDFISLTEDLSADIAKSDDITDYGDLLIAVTVCLDDETEQTVEIYNYDDDYCAVSVGGSVKYLADESLCDDIYDSFKAVVKTMAEEDSTAA